MMAGIDPRRRPISFDFMDQIFPNPVDDVDPKQILETDERQSISGRPWVAMNMISSIDGAIEVDGVSGGLGGPPDKRMFSALRAMADVILVGAGTVIAEDYRRPQTPPAIQELRVARGQSALPQIAIVSNSLSIEPSQRVFDAEAPPLVITHSAASPQRRGELSAVAHVIVAGDEAVDLGKALRLLHDNGTNVVLLEGGPRLNNAMLSAQLVDEMFVSISPMAVGGTSGRMIVGNHTEVPLPMALSRVLHEEGFLFLRYLRATYNQPTNNE